MAMFRPSYKWQLRWRRFWASVREEIMRKDIDYV